MIKKIINRILLKKALINNKRSSNKIVCYSDSIGVEIILNGFYEKTNLEILKKAFDIELKNSTFLDIGANIGNHSLFFQSYFKKIVSFEPQKQTFKVLSINTEKYDNIHAKNFGLDLENKKVKFYIPFDNNGMASPKIKSINSYEEDVELRKIHNNDYKNVGFIKIDVEGNELNVLISLNEIINQTLPVISFELNQNVSSRKKILDFLNSKGYSTFYVPYEYLYQKDRIRRLYGSLFCNKLVKIDEKLLLDNSLSFTLVSTFNTKSIFKLKV